MSEIILRSKTVHKVARTPRSQDIKNPSLPDVATVLLPGLQHARSVLDMAIRVLRDCAGLDYAP